MVNQESACDSSGRVADPSYVCVTLGSKDIQLENKTTFNVGTLQ